MQNPATNFTQAMIDEINEIIKFVLENEYSDFYRKKYGNADFYPIKSYEDFQKIPFLTKDEILAVKIKDRTFIPDHEISHYSLSSGTTNNKKLTIVPHSSLYNNTNFQEDKIKAAGADKILLLMPPTSFVFYKAITSRVEKIKFIPADVHNLPLSAIISKELEINGLMLTATILERFIEQLQQTNFPFDSVRWISLGGEFCSKKKLEFFKTFFPKANFAFRFGTSEIGPRGYRCQILTHKEPSFFHPMKGSLMEIVDTKGNLVSCGNNGEIIHTDLGKKAFPLIRYKTRDAATIYQEACTCSENFSFSLGGRFESDILKFSGATLHVQLIEDSLNSFSELLEPTFQMHVFEEQIGCAIKPQLEIHLKLKPQFAQNKNQTLFVEKLSQEISKKLYLARNKSLKDLIEKDLFLPLKIKFIDSLSESHTKAKYIISHLS